VRYALYTLLFILIQMVNLPLMVLGWFMPPPVAEMLWLWWNDDDQALLEGMSMGQQYVYLSWRNPVANLRHVWGVSGNGRPLWWRHWTINGKVYYAKAGWMSDGLPCLSAGAGEW
jgi:hypothetical protein